MEVPVFWQALAAFGAVCCLIAYGGHQLKVMRTDSVLYNLLNFIGGSALAWAAFHPVQIGFILMEGTWTIISLYALVNLQRRKQQD